MIRAIHACDYTCSDPSNPLITKTQEPHDLKTRTSMSVIHMPSQSQASTKVNSFPFLIPSYHHTGHTRAIIDMSISHRGPLLQTDNTIHHYSKVIRQQPDYNFIPHTY